MESMGFVYSDYVTKKMRKIANQDFRRNDFLRAMENHKKKTFGVGQHLIKTLQVSQKNVLLLWLSITGLTSRFLSNRLTTGIHQSIGSISSRARSFIKRGALKCRTQTFWYLKATYFSQ